MTTRTGLDDGLGNMTSTNESAALTRRSYSLPNRGRHGNRIGPNNYIDAHADTSLKIGDAPAGDEIEGGHTRRRLSDSFLSTHVSRRPVYFERLQRIDGLPMRDEPTVGLLWRPLSTDDRAGSLSSIVSGGSQSTLNDISESPECDADALDDDTSECRNSTSSCEIPSNHESIHMKCNQVHNRRQLEILKRDYRISNSPDRLSSATGTPDFETRPRTYSLPTKLLPHLEAQRQQMSPPSRCMRVNGDVYFERFDGARATRMAAAPGTFSYGPSGLAPLQEIDSAGLTR